MIWAEAEGCRVVDGDGRRLLDLSGGFGVAALGHRNPEVWAAVEAQAARCVHALGDLAEADVTAELRRRLGLGGHEVKLGVTGEDAVEIALRTALLVTDRPGSSPSRAPTTAPGSSRSPRPGSSASARPSGPGSPGRCIAFRTARILARCRPDAGCVIVEPVQGRAGARVPPAGFLERLRERCDEAGALLIADEVYCGLGRTGTLWASDGLADVLVTGKALGGGLPISACLMRPEHADAWPRGPEDVYTHTHTGNPLAAAAALVVLERIPELLDRVREAG